VVNRMTHEQLVDMMNAELAPINLRFERISPYRVPSVLLLSRQPGFDEAKSDAELATLIRSRLNVQPALAEAIKNLDISLI